MSRCFASALVIDHCRNCCSTWSRCCWFWYWLELRDWVKDRQIRNSGNSCHRCLWIVGCAVTLAMYRRYYCVVHGVAKLIPSWHGFVPTTLPWCLPVPRQETILSLGNFVGSRQIESESWIGSIGPLSPEQKGSEDRTRNRSNWDRFGLRQSEKNWNKPNRSQQDRGSSG